MENVSDFSIFYTHIIIKTTVNSINQIYFLYILYLFVYCYNYVTIKNTDPFPVPYIYCYAQNKC